MANLSSFFFRRQKFLASSSFCLNRLPRRTSLFFATILSFGKTSCILSRGDRSRIDHRPIVCFCSTRPRHFCIQQTLSYSCRSPCFSSYQRRSTDLSKAIALKRIEFSLVRTSDGSFISWLEVGDNKSDIIVKTLMLT